MKARYIPAGSRKVASKKAQAVVYLTDRPGAARPFGAIGYVGKGSKPNFHYGWPTEEARAKYLARFFRECEAAEIGHAKMLAERKARRSQKSKLQVGHILRCSWGYDQTNVDFYQVTRAVSDTMVEIRPIASTRVDGDGWQGRVMPLPDEFTGDAMRKRVTNGDSVKIESYASAYIWSGTPAYESSTH